MAEKTKPRDPAAIETTVVEAAKVALAPPPAESTPTTPGLFPVHARDGSIVELADADCRPAGRIADQVTTGTGLWARRPDSAWWKTPCRGESRAFARVRNSATASEAMVALLRP